MPNPNQTVIDFLQEEIDENILQEVAHAKEHGPEEHLHIMQARLVDFEFAIRQLRGE